MTSYDINKVSQKVIQYVQNIENSDQQKGFNSEELKKLGEYLNSGEVSGNANIAYVKEKITESKIELLKQNISIGVKDMIDKAMSFFGDPNKIDDSAEVNVLDHVIENKEGEYSAEEVEYAKLLKANSEVANNTTAALEEENAQLKRENSQLKQKIRRLETPKKTIKKQSVNNTPTKPKTNPPKGEFA